MTSFAAGVAVASLDEQGPRVERRVPFSLTDERVLSPPDPRPRPRPPLPARNRIAEARGYAASRLGSVSFGIIDSEGRASDMHGDRRYVTASVVKAMLLIAELDRLAASGAPLDSGTRGVLDAMITYSDNAAADSIYGRVGDAGLYAVAEDAGLENFAVTGYWANAQLTATDMARLMGRLDSLLAGPHAEYGSGVLGRVITAQRWGIPAAVADDGWSLRFKGGWRPTESGELVHQIASLSRDGTSVSLAVLTDGNPTMAYGVETVRGVAERLLSPEYERRARGGRR